MKRISDGIKGKVDGRHLWLGGRTPKQSAEPGSEQEYLDLQELESIRVITNHDDDLAMRQADAKRRRSSNVLAGAAFGALLDGSIGDDSILDGALIGAAFGYAGTPGVGEPLARVQLGFRDGRIDSFQVSRDEITLLHEELTKSKRARQARKESQGHEPEPRESLRVYTLSPSEAHMEQRAQLASFTVIVGIGLAFFGFAPLLLQSFAQSHPNAQPLQSTVELVSWYVITPLALLRYATYATKVFMASSRLREKTKGAPQ